MQPTAIGDTIIASGMVRAVAQRYPEAEIMVLHGPTNAGALAMIDGAFTAQALPFTKPWTVVKALRELKPEVVVDLTPWPRTTALSAMASGAVTVGYDSPGQARGAAFDVRVPHGRDRHEFENNRAMAAVFAPGWRYQAAIKRSWPAPAKPLPYDRLILLHTNAGGSRKLEKAWPAEKWSELAKRLHKDGFVLGLSGAKAETAELEAFRIAAGLPEDGMLNLGGVLSLTDLAYALQHSRCLVSVDTGPIHLASALDAPVVGLFGPTSSKRWGPWGAGGRAVDSAHPAAGFCSLGFEMHPKAGEMMQAIPVDAVYAAVKGAVEARKPVSA